MTERGDEVKVFISWSGPLARDVALVLRKWLPFLSDRLAPFVSDADISAGERGLKSIESQLEDAGFGIVVVTSDNKDAPWLNFEAGALSRAVNDTGAEKRVVLLLVDLTGPSELTGPLTQFQVESATQSGMRSLARSLAGVAQVSTEAVDARFEAFWDGISGEIDQATAVNRPNQTAVREHPKRDQAEVLDEILSIARVLRSEILNKQPVSPSSSTSADPLMVLFHRLRGVAFNHGFTVEHQTTAQDGGIKVIMCPRPGQSGESSIAVEILVAELAVEFGKRIDLAFVPPMQADA